MNANTFRLVFSKRLGMLVPVAEIATARAKGGEGGGAAPRGGRAAFLLRALAISIAAVLAGPTLALPTAPVVANGTASFSQAGNVLTVTNSNGAIINWQSFNIAAGETTRFVQPSAGSSVLNQVLTSNPSALYGTLSSNGKVWLVNPAGILVGPGAVIDTAGFVASTLTVRAEDFLAGKLNFQATPGAGSVINQGEIRTPAGGSVYLVGPSVTNEGIINAPNGEVILAAGQTVELIDTATPGVKVEITGAESNATNLGQIVAEAGRIGIAGAIVRNSGTLDASSVVSEGGRIFLRATQGMELTAGSKVSADGTAGGEITAIVRDGEGRLAGRLVADGELTAAGGGGFIETSAAELALGGNLSIAAPGGRWLIDPYDYLIDSDAASTISSALSNGTSVYVSTQNDVSSFGSTGLGAGDITVAANISKASGGDAVLGLYADRNIIINSGVSVTSYYGMLDVDLSAGNSGNGSIVMNGSFNITGGLTAHALGGALTVGAGANLSAAAVKLMASGNVSLGGSINATAPYYYLYDPFTGTNCGYCNVWLHSIGGNLTVGGSVVASNGSDARIRFEAPNGTLTINAPVTATGGTYSIFGGTAIFAHGRDVTVGDNLTATHASSSNGARIEVGASQSLTVSSGAQIQSQSLASSGSAELWLKAPMVSINGATLQADGGSRADLEVLSPGGSISIANSTLTASGSDPYIGIRSLTNDQELGDYIEATYPDSFSFTPAAAIDIYNRIAGSGDVSLTNTTLSGAQDVDLVGRNVVLGNSSVSGNNVYLIAQQGLSLANGASATATSELVAMSGTGLTLTGGSFLKVHSPVTMYFLFPLLTADGWTVDGVVNGYGNPQSGSYLSVNGAPPVPGANFFVIYGSGGLAQNSAVQQVLQAMQTLTQLDLPAVDALTTQSGAGGASAESAGGGAGEFGEGENKGKGKKAGRCKG